ncbi:MAG: asparagine synthetase B, partial [Clostridium lundense]|nr:asparagine synthetase B [Clostridium lundense]
RKIILKDAFRDLIPEELLTSPKKGFGVPIGKWLGNELYGRLKEYADREFIHAQGIFDAKYINSLIENHVYCRENRYSELWTFFVFQSWYERVMC